MAGTSGFNGDHKIHKTLKYLQLPLWKEAANADLKENYQDKRAFSSLSMTVQLVPKAPAGVQGQQPGNCPAEEEALLHTAPLFPSEPLLRAHSRTGLLNSHRNGKNFPTKRGVSFS